MMKLVTAAAALAFCLPIVPAWAQDLQVSPDGRRIVTPPRTPKERALGLEGRPPGAVERPAPEDDSLDDPDDPEEAPPPVGRL